MGPRARGRQRLEEAGEALTWGLRSECSPADSLALSSDRRPWGHPCVPFQAPVQVTGHRSPRTPPMCDMPQHPRRG